MRIQAYRLQIVWPFFPIVQPQRSPHILSQMARAFMRMHVHAGSVLQTQGGFKCAQLM